MLSANRRHKMKAFKKYGVYVNGKLRYSSINWEDAHECANDLMGEGAVWLAKIGSFVNA